MSHSSNSSIYYLKSPMGQLEAKFTKAGLAGLYFVPSEKAATHTKKAKDKNRFGAEVIDILKEELSKFFAGKLKTSKIKLDLNGATEFEIAVWNELKKIPHGKTLTYGEIAQNLGDKNKARAVGSACGRNRIILLIPCHRVVAQNGPGGFSAHGGLELKTSLLDMEGMLV